MASNINKAKIEALAKEDKSKAFEAAVETLKKKYGEGVIMSLGKKPQVVQSKIIPTGIIGLDIALGIGGIPRGRLIEIYGQESTGKTTLTLQIIAQVHRFNGLAVFIDAEHALDPEYAELLGVNLEKLYISQPDYGEQALQIAEDITRSGAVDLIVVDSVAALVPKSELEGAIGDVQPGSQARLMSQALRRLAAVAAKTGTAIIFINQLREKLSMGPGYHYGPQETTPGGRALKFYASVRISLRRGATIREGDQEVGNEVHVKISKNKLAPPFKHTKLELIPGEGLSPLSSLIDTGIEYGFIKRSGSWYSYGDVKLGQGKTRAKEFLKTHPELVEELEKKIREAAGIPVVESLE